MSIAVGVDGCRAGWFYFQQDNKTITHGLARGIHNLLDTLPECSRVFIDIPIGLVDQGSAGRICDASARKLLGTAKAASVFSAPCRPVLKASSYEEAKEISFKAIGKKLSKQTFLITSKIKEVDDYLQNQGHNIVVREVHPELCFWALNGCKTVISHKKSEDGFKERLLLLSKYVPNIKDLVGDVLTTYLRKKVARDDILDALIAMVVASTSDDALSTTPVATVLDSVGLPMEIVYAEKPNKGAL
jgi:predicted RNase H-like nuclease